MLRNTAGLGELLRRAETGLLLLAVAKVGVATSSTPCGPYLCHGSSHPLGFQNTSCTLRSLNSGLVIDIPKGSTTAGTALDRWSSNGGSNQVWRVS
ncbi:RICIN domain-containing protein [Streptomyces sp. NBC_00669]|uniref:RICIN domain-containing protein n=1 Tax=Streptomyces sp. NBC_00669 TaxID=2976011 RepID=UPI002E3154FB|nr:RICIN domain-containing protein [Streptomyces sp. NBC_00669]